MASFDVPRRSNYSLDDSMAMTHKTLTKFNFTQELGTWSGCTYPRPRRRWIIRRRVVSSLPGACLDIGWRVREGVSQPLVVRVFILEGEESSEISSSIDQIHQWWWGAPYSATLLGHELSQSLVYICADHWNDIDWFWIWDYVGDIA